jgi:hypothetical protein
VLPRSPHVNVGEVRTPGLGRRGQALRIQDARRPREPHLQRGVGQLRVPDHTKLPKAPYFARYGRG